MQKKIEKRSAAATQKRILTAAKKAFARKGLGGARVDEIALSANANKRMIYHYFGDKENLDLMEEDLNTIKNLKDKGYKVLVLLISGRPMNIADHIDNWDGFAALWLPGTEGDGVSDILFGDFQPTGKLSYPWPVNTEEGANALVSDLLFDIGFGL